MSRYSYPIVFASLNHAIVGLSDPRAMPPAGSCAFEDGWYYVLERELPVGPFDCIPSLEAALLEVELG